jgi:hypothetical protein
MKELSEGNVKFHRNFYLGRPPHRRKEENLFTVQSIIRIYQLMFPNAIMTAAIKDDCLFLCIK